MKKIITIIVTVVIAVGLIILGVKAVKKAQARDAQIPKAVVNPIVISSLVPRKTAVRLTLPYLAEVANDRDVQLSSKIAARIEMIKKSGIKVKKGDVIARLDTTSLASNIKGVEAEIVANKVALRNLKETHSRTLELLTIKGASVEQSEEESTKIAVLEAKMSGLEQKKIELENMLSYGKVTAPVDGTITVSFGNAGEMSMPGKPLVSIGSENGFYLLVRVPGKYHINSLIMNDKRYKTIELGSTFHGLAEYKVYVDDRRLTSGDRIQVAVVVYEGNTVKLPFDALLNREGKSYVIALHDGSSEVMEVHVIQSGEEGVVIEEPLDDKTIAVAKPDILLKLVAGHAYSIKE
jgi:multidrug efflux pump subunit AcrA (membrane-fusion protein)